MEPSTLAFLIVFGVALVALYVATSRAITIVDLEIQRGVIRVVRGGIAPPVLADLRDVAKGSFGLSAIEDVSVRVVRSSGRAEVQFRRGTISKEHQQQIRNVIGGVPFARLINAPRKR